MPFEDYEPFTFDAAGVDIFGMKGGNGPPLLLLHGHPQTHEIWHRLAGVLAQHFTVIATDLRGYGASAKPPSDAQHTLFETRDGRRSGRGHAALWFRALHGLRA